MATILVVDDEYAVRSLLKQVLTIHRHNVLEASDGTEALKAIAPNALPDLIFMDHQMPNLSGIESAKSIKSLYPFLKIVLISGSFGINDDGYLVANKHLFSDIILKPFQIKDVVRAVEYTLGSEAQEKRNLPLKIAKYGRHGSLKVLR